MDAIPIGLVGVGKIARDQHLPVIAANPAFRLVATADPHAGVDGVTNHPSMDEMLAAHPEIVAVSLCTPTQVRRTQAAAALAAGKAVLLEKPPGSTLSEIEILIAEAKAANAPLFAAWHSRFSPAVEPARAWLASRTVKHVRIEWRENVRKWHPGQAWIWEAGGLGVFDPGVNALSIATRILPQPFFLTKATLSSPQGRQSPIAADLAFSDASGVDIAMSLDWRQTAGDIWTIEVGADGGTLLLTEGGAKLAIDGQAQPLAEAPHAEYTGVYKRFAELVQGRESDVDPSPLRHAADAFLLGERVSVEAFEDAPSA